MAASNQADPDHQIRRQLTLFLPSAQRSLVEPVRKRLDPLQHTLIDAHVTLCRDDELLPLEVLDQRFAKLNEIALTMHFGEPEVLDDGCVLVRPTRGAGQYQRLRQSILGPSANAHGAHLTLLHPRHAAGVTYDLTAISRELAGLTVTFRSVALIEQTGPRPWKRRRVYR